MTQPAVANALRTKMILLRITALLVLLVTPNTRAFGLSNPSASSKIVPPLYRYDDFEKCRPVNHPGEFCYVRVVFKTDVDPINSDRIETNFRHNLLDWGICVSECEREVAALGEADRDRLFYPKFQINHSYIWPGEYFGSKLESLKAKHSELINVCVNNRLERNYNLTRHGYSEIESCVSNDPLEEREEFDWLTMVFLALIVTLVVTLVGATLLDWFGGDHLKDHIVVSSFSIRRNWSRFTQESNSELYRDFGYIDGLRVLISIFLMSLHCSLMFILVPTVNPEVLETWVKTAFVVNSSATFLLAIQLFFVISGLLLMGNFLKDIERQPRFNVEYFRNKIINRLIRLLPVYYFFLLMTVVGHAIPGLKLGYAGYQTLIVERALCRKDVWSNVFLVNNLPFTEGKCFLQGWYLGADQQMFLASLVVLALLWNRPGKAKQILWVVVVISIVTPVSLISILGLESILPVRLSEMKFCMTGNQWFNHIYRPGYTNMNSFIGGMIVGYIYHKTKCGKFNLDDSRLFKVLKRTAVPLLLLGLMTSHLFYQYEVPRSSWWIPLHSIILRNCGVITICLCFVNSFRKPPGLFRRVLSSRLMTRLGQLSYSVYVLHIPLLRVLLNYIPTLLNVSASSIFMLFVAAVILSYLAGFLVYFSIEQPLGLVLKYWFFERRCQMVKVE